MEGKSEEQIIRRSTVRRKVAKKISRFCIIARRLRLIFVGWSGPGIQSLSRTQSQGGKARLKVADAFLLCPVIPSG